MTVLIGQNDQFQGHEHKLGRGLVNNVENTSGLGYGGQPTQMYGAKLSKTDGVQSDDVNGTPRVGNETRGKNLTVRYWKRIS